MRPNFNRWLGRKRADKRVQAESSVPSPSPSGSGVADNIEPAAQDCNPKVPDAFHESSWALLKRHGDFNVKRERNIDDQILLLVMGASGVGKKALVRSLLYGNMLGGEGMDLSMLLMEDEVPRYYCDGCIYSLKIISATDSEALSPAMFRRYDHFGLILAYDVTSRASLDFISQLHERIAHSHGGGITGVSTALLGLKSDMGPENQHERISREEGEQLARRWACYFNECSSKTGNAVYDSFGHFVRVAHQVGSPNFAVVGHDKRASTMEAFVQAASVGLAFKGSSLT